MKRIGRRLLGLTTLFTAIGTVFATSSYAAGGPTMACCIAGSAAHGMTCCLVNAAMQCCGF